MHARIERYTRTHQNWEVTAGGVGKWASSWPMLEKKSPVRLLPLMAGTLDGPIQPMSPKPMTLRSLRSQSRGNLAIERVRRTEDQQFHRELVIKSSISVNSRHAGDPAIPLQVPAHQGVPRRHPAAPREACSARIIS
jgi:hypothetical protein